MATPLGMGHSNGNILNRQQSQNSSVIPQELEQAAEAAQISESTGTLEGSLVGLRSRPEENGLAAIGLDEHNILASLQIAWVANSLGLPNNAADILKRTYSLLRGDLYRVLSELNGQPPSPAQQQAIEKLRALQDMVLIRMKGVLGSYGGPNLTIEEVEAMMITDRDMDPQGLNPQAAEILKSFNHNKSPEALKKNAFSAVDKIAKKLPELLLSVAETLQTLMANPDAGAGSARMFVNNALSKLELCKALLRLLSGTENVFKAMAVESLELGSFQEQVDELSTQADQVYKDLETRGFIRGRANGLSNMPTIEELEMMAKNPDAFKQKMEALNPQNLDKNQKPITQPPTIRSNVEVPGLSGLGNSIGKPGLIGLNAQG